LLRALLGLNQDALLKSQVLEAVKLLVEELGADVNTVSDLVRPRCTRRIGVRTASFNTLSTRARSSTWSPKDDNALIVADGVELRQFVCCPTAHRGVAAETGRKGNEVSAPCAAALPEKEP